MQALHARELVVLRRLRERFLSRVKEGGYWRDVDELALYDVTFAERIGWKWDAVIAEVQRLGWKPSVTHVCDFGCGSGVAGRRVLAAWPSKLETLELRDVSTLAVRYALAKATELFPEKRVEPGAGPLSHGTLLLISHVVNELDDAGREALLALARQADAVLWVESGSHADSRALIAMREALRDEMEPFAPCVHRGRCGMLEAINERHWCHHFAPVPSFVFQDAGWMAFGRAVGIDLRALPYSYLALERRTLPHEPSATRIIGHPRESKGRMELLTCRTEAVAELTLQKRDAPELFKALQKGRAAHMQKMAVAAGKLKPISDFVDEIAG